jgi:hypothetical protein
MRADFELLTVPMVQELGYKSMQRYIQHRKFILDGLNLDGTRILEIGCGRGAWAIYGIMRSLTAARGTLIIADAARSNYWGLFGMRSPFAPSG